MIHLPKDAEGREIPLDTSELLIADGTKVPVVRFEYEYRSSDQSGTWFVKVERTPGEYLNLHTSDVHLTTLDSLGRLLGDLNKTKTDTEHEKVAPCAWFNPGYITLDCNNCRGFKKTDCSTVMLAEIIDRIVKLRSKS